MLLDGIFLLILIACAIAVICIKDILSAVMTFTVYSLVMTIVWTRLNAVDVAVTEAAVGAGITTVLFIVAISRTKRQEPERKRRFPAAPLVVVVLTGAVLIYGSLGMPDFDSPDAAPHQHVAPHYLEHGYEETGVPNIVTAVLASYRGYDTLGEATVIFTAGMGVMLLLRKKSSSKKEKAGVDYHESSE